MKLESAETFGEGINPAMDAAVSALEGLEGLMPHQISPNEYTLEVAFDLIYKLQSELADLKREIEGLK